MTIVLVTATVITKDSLPVIPRVILVLMVMDMGMHRLRVIPNIHLVIVAATVITMDSLPVIPMEILSVTARDMGMDRLRVIPNSHRIMVRATIFNLDSLPIMPMKILSVMVMDRLRVILSSYLVIVTYRGKGMNKVAMVMGMDLSQGTRKATCMVVKFLVATVTILSVQGAATMLFGMTTRIRQDKGNMKFSQLGMPVMPMNRLGGGCREIPQRQVCHKQDEDQRAWREEIATSAWTS
jgi:hypothetical protein